MDNLLKKIGIGFSSLILTLNIALAKDFKLFSHIKDYTEKYFLQYGDLEDNNHDLFYFREVYLHPVPEVAEEMHESIEKKFDNGWFRVYWDNFENQYIECARIEDMPEEIKYIINKVKEDTELYKDLMVITRFKKDDDLAISFHKKYNKDKEFYEQMTRLLNSKGYKMNLKKILLGMGIAFFSLTSNISSQENKENFIENYGNMISIRNFESSITIGYDKDKDGKEDYRLGYVYLGKDENGFKYYELVVIYEDKDRNKKFNEEPIWEKTKNLDKKLKNEKKIYVKK